MAMYACHRYGGGKLKEIGEHFGTGDTAVSQASKRLSAEAEMDKNIAELLARVDGKLGLWKVEL